MPVGKRELLCSRSKSNKCYRHKKKKKRHDNNEKINNRILRERERCTYINKCKNNVISHNKSIWLPNKDIEYDVIDSHSWFDIELHSNNRKKQFTSNPAFFK